MPPKTYRGVVRHGTVVFLEAVPPLSDGTEVLVTPVPAALLGTRAASCAAGGAPADVPAEPVGEPDRHSPGGPESGFTPNERGLQASRQVEAIQRDMRPKQDRAVQDYLREARGGEL